MSPEREKPRFSRRTLLKGGVGAIGAATLGTVAGQRVANGESHPEPSEQIEAEWPVFETNTLLLQYPPEWPPAVETNIDDVEYIRFGDFSDPEKSQRLIPDMKILTEPEDQWQDNLEDYKDHIINKFVNGVVPPSENIDVNESVVDGNPAYQIISTTPDIGEDFDLLGGFTYIRHIFYSNGEPWRITLANPLHDPLYEENFQKYEKALSTLRLKTPYPY